MKRQRKPPRWVVTTHRTQGYGMFETTVTRPDGRVFTGHGLTALQSEYRARRRAGERCG